MESQAQKTRQKVVDTLKFYNVEDAQVARKIVKNMARRENIEFNTTEKHMQMIINQEVA